MGRSTTPTFRVEFTKTYKLSGFNHMAWYSTDGPNRTGYGKPTEANLAKLIKHMNQSYQPGGANAHLQRAGQDRPSSITEARIVRQSTGKVVATYAVPMFEVL